MTTPVDRQTAVALTKNSVGLEGVASFNSAIYGWLSKGKIRNIDGLANQDVWFALKRKTFGEYLQKEDIHYILDLYSTREGAMEQSESYINGNSQTIRVRLHPVVTLPDRGGWTHILSRIEYFTQENR